jgi:hypothetical protein
MTSIDTASSTRWTRLARIDATGHAATRRQLGYLLRAFVRAVDASKIGEHRHGNLARELGNCLLPTALGATSAAQWFADLCDRFAVDAMAVSSDGGEARPLAVFFPASRELIEWHRLIAGPALGIDAVREAFRESPDLYATFATTRAADDPEDDEQIWRDLAAQPLAEHTAAPLDLPDPAKLIPTPLWAAILTTVAPLAHGADSKAGNVNLIRREPIIDPLTGRRVEVPLLAGNALRGQLRDLMMLRYLDLVGLTPEEIPPAMAHALLAGGSIESGADSVAIVLGVRRAWRSMCPPWDLIAGVVPGQPPMAGIFSTQDVVLVCRENAWRVHPYVARPGETVGDLAARLPPCDTLVTTRQSVRQAHRELEGAEGSQMLMQTEVLLAGAQMVHTFRYKPEATPSQLSGSCLADALDVIAHGGLTGARTSTAFGAFRTDGWHPRMGAAPLPDPQIYVDWTREHGDEIRAWLKAGGVPQGIQREERTTSTEAKAAAKKGASGKRGKAEAPPPAPEPDPVVTDAATGKQKALF